MSWSRSLSFGFGLTFAGLTLLLLTAFIYGLDLEVPLVFTLTSIADPMPRTSLDVSPFGILTVASLLSVLLHYAAQLIAKSRKNARQAP